MNLPIELSRNKMSLSTIQSPVIVSFWERDAGPPEPQSSLTTVSVEPDAVSSKWPSSKLRVLVVAWTVVPDLSVLKVDAPPESSSPQKNLPVVVSQPKAWPSASQSIIPIPVDESVSLKLEMEAMEEEIEPTTRRSEDINRSEADLM